MSSPMSALYQEVILDLSRRPHGKGLLGGPDATAHEVNPTCGDEVTVELRLDPGSGVVTAFSWEGEGCAISQASASILADLAPGLTVGDLRDRVQLFRTAMRSRGAIEPDETLLGDAVALGGVSRYVARVKCAMLPWVAAESALR